MSEFTTANTVTTESLTTLFNAAGEPIRQTLGTLDPDTGEMVYTDVPSDEMYTGVHIIYGRSRPPVEPVADGGKQELYRDDDGDAG